METIDKTVGQRLTMQYIFALSVVAILTVLGQFLIQYTLSHSLNDAHTINLAGRQRMLSQKMVKNTLVLKNYKLDKNTQLKYIVEIKSDLAVWEKNHFLLKNLSDEKKFGNNKKFENLIHAQYQSIQKDYDILVNILKSVNENSIQSINDLELIASGQSFLEKMDKIVFTYDDWSTKQVITIKKI